MLEGRRAQFVDLLGGRAEDAVAVDAAIDRLVHYAGWTDKLAAVFGGANPVAGPYFSFSTPEPTGVVAAIAPQHDPLLGLVSVIAPIITSGNTAVVIASQQQPLAAVTLAEVLATSDLPGGVVNILTGDPAEIAPHLAAHGDVNALDLTGTDGALRTDSGAGRRRHRQAGLCPCRAGLLPAAGDGPAARVPGDQDGLASDRRGVAGGRRRVLTGCVRL